MIVDYHLLLKLKDSDFTANFCKFKIGSNVPAIMKHSFHISATLELSDQRNMRWKRENNIFEINIAMRLTRRQRRKRSQFLTCQPKALSYFTKNNICTSNYIYILARLVFSQYS